MNPVHLLTPPCSSKGPDVCTDTHPQALAGRKLPLEVPVEGSDVDTSGDIDTLCEVIDVLQGSLDTVKDGPHDSWAQLDREGLPCPQHGISNGHTSCAQAQGNQLTLGESPEYFPI